MLLKKILLALAVAVPLTAFSLDVGEVMEGSWKDGTNILYQCSGKFKGDVKIVITTVEGKQYAGILKCGASV
jgi:hypothetical protein